MEQGTSLQVDAFIFFNKKEDQKNQLEPEKKKKHGTSWNRNQAGTKLELTSTVTLPEREVSKDRGQAAEPFGPGVEELHRGRPLPKKGRAT